jgi:chromosome segregation ATPase
VDLQSSKESLERDMAFLKDRAQLSEARLEKEGEDASREMMAMQHALDERMQNEIEHWKDQVTSWKLQVEKQELRCDELETACEDWEGKFVDVEAECNEKEEVSLSGLR